MNKSVNAFFKLGEYAEISEVAHFCRMAAADRILVFYVLPRVRLELFDAERHLALFAIKR